MERDLFRNGPMCILVGDVNVETQCTTPSLHTVTKINPMDYADFKTRSQVWKSRKKILALTCRDYTSAKTMYVVLYRATYVVTYTMFLSYSLVSVGCGVRNTRYQNKDNRKFNRQKRNLLKKSCHALQVQAHTPQLPGRLFSLTDIWKKLSHPILLHYVRKISRGVYELCSLEDS